MEEEGKGKREGTGSEPRERRSEITPI